MNIPLSQFKERVVGKITSIESEDILLKLMEYGIMPGAMISIQNSAPFNGPLAVFVNGSKLILRKEEAQFVFVTL